MASLFRPVAEPFDRQYEVLVERARLVLLTGRRTRTQIRPPAVITG
jgi:hypothetical protein